MITCPTPLDSPAGQAAVSPVITNISTGSNCSSVVINNSNTLSVEPRLQDFPPRQSVSLASPQQRKMSEFSQDSLLNPNGFTRLTPSPGANSSRLYKKIEEMMDLSSPYNHYRCLSSESNLTQCGNNLMGMGSMLQNLATLGGNLSVPPPQPPTIQTPQQQQHTSLTIPEQTTEGKSLMNNSSTLGCGVGGGVVDNSSRPGSGRLLRRQFSLDKDDVNNNSNNNNSISSVANSLSNNLGNSACLQGATLATVTRSGCNSASSVDSAYQKHSSLPSISGQTLMLANNNSRQQPQITNRTPLCKHNSSSQDLEKIDENPGSPLPPFQPHRPHHVAGLYSQSSLTNSIPFIDGSSCSSSASTLTSLALGGAGGDSGMRKVIQKDTGGGGGGVGAQEAVMTSTAVDVEGVIADRREMNLNTDPLLLR